MGIKEDYQQALMLAKKGKLREAKQLLEAYNHPKTNTLLIKIDEAIIAEEYPRKPKHNSPDDINRMLIVCPVCDHRRYQSVSESQLTIHSEQDFTCPECNETFTSRFATIRAKRSRGNKNYHRRVFDVRVENMNGTEDLIQFQVDEFYDNKDFELRSKDLAIFTYFQGQLIVIQNLTINIYMRTIELKRKNEAGCKHSVVGTSIILVLLIMICGLFFLAAYMPAPGSPSSETISPNALIQQIIREHAEDGEVKTARLQDGLLFASFISDESARRILETQIWHIACDIRAANLQADEYTITAYRNDEDWIISAWITPEELRDLDCSEDAPRLSDQIDDYSRN